MKKLRFALSLILICMLIFTTSVSALSFENTNDVTQPNESTQSNEVTQPNEVSQNNEKAVTWDDVFAGIADPREMYDALDPDTVPAIIG